MTRLHRVHAFCDWLDTIAPDPPFFRQAGFSAFADLTDGEIMAAQIEMRRRAAAASREADALHAEQVKRARRIRAEVANDDPEPPEAA